MDREKKTAPDISLTLTDGVIEVYVVRTDQYIKLGEQKSLTFPHRWDDKTPSIVYVRRSAATGIQANELDIDDGGTWEWIQDMMQKGIDSL